MSKSFIKPGLVALAALALASCATTDEFQHNPDSALQIESVGGISPFAMMQEPASKAVITSDSLPDDEAAKGIGLFVTAEDGSAYDGHDSGYSNVKYIYNGSKWNTTTPIYLSGSVGKLYGYFPYNPDATDLRAIPVASSLNGTDYLYANPMTVNHSEKNVTLQMNHALSRLHLTIKKGSNFTAGASLSEITLKSTAFDATGTLDLTTGTITASKKSGETGTVELPADGTITAQGIEKDILLVPADGTEGKKDIAISLMIAGKPTGITLSGDSGLDLRSGIQNNVILTIEDTGIKVSGVDVGVWGEGGSQEVQVSGHKVTVKLSEDTGIADDVLTNVKVEGENVIIKAYSESGQHLKCSLGEGVFSPLNKTSNLVYAFTLSDITSDVIATIGYAKPVTVNVSSNNTTFGTAEFVGDCYEGEHVTFTAKTAKNEYVKFVEWQDDNGKTICTENPYDVTLTSNLSLKVVFEVPEGVIDINGHWAVELAGTYWSTESVGYVSDDLHGRHDNVYGYYYAWGNRKEGFPDLLYASLAVSSWGGNDDYVWGLPSLEQLNILAENCYWEWVSNYNYTEMNGYIIYKAKNDADKGMVGGIEGYSTDSDIYIFLPAAGCYSEDSQGSHYSISKGSLCYLLTKTEEWTSYFFEDGHWKKVTAAPHDGSGFQYPLRPVAIPK